MTTDFILVTEKQYKNNQEISISRLSGIQLAKARTRAGLTQTELAKRMGVGQSAISKIENRENLKNSSISEYLQAVRATLPVNADFLHGSNKPISFPIAHAAEKDSNSDVILSIKPKFTEKIIDGTKTVELRRRFPRKTSQGCKAYIYSTSPDRAIVAIAEINRVHELPIAEIWRKCHSKASVSKIEFNSYFNGLLSGFAIEITNVSILERRLDLDELRDRFQFTPPQSYYYAKPEITKAIMECRN